MPSEKQNNLICGNMHDAKWIPYWKRNDDVDVNNKSLVGYFVEAMLLGSNYYTNGKSVYFLLNGAQRRQQLLLEKCICGIRFK